MFERGLIIYWEYAIKQYFSLLCENEVYLWEKKGQNENVQKTSFGIRQASRTFRVKRADCPKQKQSYQASVQYKLLQA